ncbi:MAG TPA: hypothetical protein VFV68_04850, partial [Agriterribacter sp.]|nr:hypothetical protein [Agriterribacter sp.]
MLQPFEQFKFVYLNKLIQLKKRYLVSQSYKRAKDPFSEEEKIDILLSDYADLGQAKLHLNAVRNDKYHAILDLENDSHLEKLHEMMREGSKYRLFWAVVSSANDLENAVNAEYKDNMRRYIERNTNWRIDRDTTLHPSLQISFGELFIVLKYGSQTIRVKFEDI